MKQRLYFMLFFFIRQVQVGVQEVRFRGDHKLYRGLCRVLRYRVWQHESCNSYRPVLWGPEPGHHLLPDPEIPRDEVQDGL